MVIPGLSGTPCGIVVKPPNRKQEARLWLGFATHHLCVVGQVISSLESSFLRCERGVLNKVSLKVLFKSETPRLSTCARNPVELQLRVGVRVSSSLRISLTQKLPSKLPAHQLSSAQGLSGLTLSVWPIPIQEDSLSSTWHVSPYDIWIFAVPGVY